MVLCGGAVEGISVSLSASPSLRHFSLSTLKNLESPPPPPSPSPPPMPPKPASSSSYETSSGEEDDKVVPPPNPKPAAPKPQSSGSDDGGEEESSDGEEEEDSTPPPPPKPVPAPAPAPAPAASASECGSSASESGLPAPAPAAKPRPSKRPPSPTKASPATPAAATPEKKKRKSPATPAATPAATPSTGAPKKSHRIWTEEDELAILQGMLDYNAKTGILSPSTQEMEAFRRFIQKSLRVEATTYQLSEKVRRMKKKYLTTREKNPSLSFAKPHDAAVYELSQKVWGSGDGDGVNGSRAKRRRTSMNKSEKLEKLEKLEKSEKSEKPEKDDEEEDNVVEDEKVSGGVRKGRYLYFTDAVLRMGNSIGRGFLVKEAMGMIDEAKATEMDKKYKILKVQQMKSYMREMELNKEGMKVVTEALDKQA